MARIRTPKPPTDRIHRTARRQGHLRDEIVIRARDDAAWQNGAAGIEENRTAQAAADRTADRMASRGRTGIRWKPDLRR